MMKRIIKILAYSMGTLAILLSGILHYHMHLKDRALISLGLGLLLILSYLLGSTVFNKKWRHDRHLRIRNLNAQRIPRKPWFERSGWPWNWNWSGFFKATGISKIFFWQWKKSVLLKSTVVTLALAAAFVVEKRWANTTYTISAFVLVILGTAITYYAVYYMAVFVKYVAKNYASWQSKIRQNIQNMNKQTVKRLVTLGLATVSALAAYWYGGSKYAVGVFVSIILLAYWQDFRKTSKSLIESIILRGSKALVVAIYFTISLLISLLIGSLDDSIVSAIFCFTGFTILCYPLYLYVSKIVGEDASKSTQLFTAVGENEIKFTVDQSNQVLEILTPKDYIVTDDGELVKDTNNAPTFFGGLYFVGIPVISKVFTYHFEWTKLEYYTDQNEQKYRLIPRSEIVHGLRIVQQQYIEINSLETDGNEKVTLGFLITYKIIYPVKALFKTDSPGKWLVKSTAEIETMCGYHTANKSFNDLKSEDRSKHAKGSLSYKLIHEVSGHIPNDPNVDYSKTLVRLLGVAIIDADLVKFESEEVTKVKEAQQLKVLATYEADAEEEVQRKEDIKQTSENKRIVEKSKAQSTAKENLAVGEGTYYKAIRDAGGEQMYVAEKLKESKIISLGGNASTILNVDKVLENAKEDDEKNKKP